MKLYQYTWLRQDGTMQKLKPRRKMEYKDDLWKQIGDIIETIPPDYYFDKKCTLYTDENGRSNATNYRNPWFLVLKDMEGEEWDIVGDVLMEKLI